MARSQLEDASIGELVARLSEETSALIRDELRVARLEMTHKAKYAGLGAGLVGGAGVAAGFGFACLVAAGVLGLATTLSAWLSALLVGVALLAVAAAFALMGKREISEALPPVPEEAVAGIKRDLKAVKR